MKNNEQIENTPGGTNTHLYLWTIFGLLESKEIHDTALGVHSVHTFRDAMYGGLVVA
jgi:hypothetical protein